jgi:hypothetical protein
MPRPETIPKCHFLHEFKGGVVCTECGRTFCHADVPLNKCGVCQGKITRIEARYEDVLGETVCWIKRGGNDREFGFLGFDTFPRSLPDILKLNPSDTQRLIFSPSKRAGWNLLNAAGRISGSEQWEQYYAEMEKSRYSVLMVPDRGFRYILVNCGAVPSAKLSATVSFVEKSVEILFSLENSDTSNFTRMTVETLFDYVRRTGFPYVFADKESLQFGRAFPQKLPEFYAELQATQQLLESDLSEASDLVLGKLELLFSTIQSASFIPLNVIYSYLSQFTQIEVLVAIASKYDPIRPTVLDAYNRLYAQLKKNLEDFPDLLSALEAVKSSVSGTASYHSFQEFVDVIARGFRDAFGILGPRYVRLSEMDPLMIASQEYERQILSNHPTYLEGLGTVDEFFSKFAYVMEKEDNPIEIRLLMGETLLRVMTAKLVTAQDTETIRRAAGLVIRFSEILDSGLDQVHQHYGKLELAGTALDYGEGVEMLYAYGQLALVKGDSETYALLERKAVELAERRQVVSALIMFAWKSYLTTQSGAYLAKIDRLTQRPDWDSLIDMKTFLRLLKCLVESLYEGKDRFAEAKEAAIEVASTTSTSGLGFQSVLSSTAYYHTAQVFEELTLALADGPADMKTHLERAVIHSTLMKENLASQDPLLHLVRRTKALQAILVGDFERASTIVEEDNSTMPSLVVSEFNQVAMEWCHVAAKYEGRSFSHMSTVEYNDNEPWALCLRRMMLQRMNSDLESHIMGSRAIVFTEGAFDDVILEGIAHRLHPGEKVAFMSAGGYANVPYFAEARIAGSLRMPIFLLFDGGVAVDTKTRTKYLQIKDMLAIPEQRIKVLSERSIEGYLLVPAVITRAFPGTTRSTEELERFLSKRKDKQNKKAVLEALLQFCGIPRYTKEIAASLASNLERGEIDAQLVRIIDDFYGH